MLTPRVQQEFNLLLKYHPKAQLAEETGQPAVLVPDYKLPEGWTLGGVPALTCRIACLLSPAYPEGTPYAFLAPTNLTYRGQVPMNTAVAGLKPFGSEWLQFSWTPDEPWLPTAEITNGSNLIRWFASFRVRLEEGA